MTDQDFRVEMGRRLRAARSDIGKTQASIAQRVYITQAALSNYETGKREVPISTLVRLADVLGAPMVAFVPREAVAS